MTSTDPTGADVDLTPLIQLVPEAQPMRNELPMPRIHPHGPGWEQLPLFEDEGV